MKSSIQRAISPHPLDESSDDLIDSVADVRIQLGDAIQRLTRTIQETETLLGDLAAAQLGRMSAPTPTPNLVVASFRRG